MSLTITVNNNNEVIIVSYVIDCNENFCLVKFRDALNKVLSNKLKKNKTIVILCIGTDRSTGDCLGPLVGHKLKVLLRDNIYLYGTLENPVHAKNLEETISTINSEHPNALVIAIDACLGDIKNIGKIYIKEEPLSPGAALNRDLPKIGDISITGIVNISGAFEFIVLQNTRLHTVMLLSDVISRGIFHSINQISDDWLENSI